MNQRGPFPNFFTSPQMNAPNIRPFQANVFPPTPFQPRQQLLMGPIIMRQTAPQAFIQQFQPSMPSFQRSMVERNFIRPLMNGAVPPVRFPNDPGLQQRQVVNLNQQGNWNFGQVRQPQFVAQNCHQPNSVLPVRIPQQFQQESRPLVAMNPRPNPNEINRDVTPWSVRMSVSPLVQEDSVATEFLPTRIAPEMMSNQRKLMPLMEIVTCPPTTTSDNSLLRPSIHPTAAASTSSAYGQKRPLIDDPTANDFLATKMMRFSPDRPPLPVPVPHRPLIRTSINDLLIPPGREKRPEKLLLIFRGLPGSGKSHTAKLIKEKEIEYGGVAPRILCFDDYFMVEEEESVVKYGGKPTETISSYEYDPAMEPSYRKQFIKSFKKTVDGGFFNFIILDAVHQKLNYFDEMWCYARQNGYEVYVVECHADVHTCAERNIHSRSAKDIEDMWKSWEETPPHFTQVDCGPLFHQCEEEIQEVDMDLQTSSQPDAPPEPMTSDDRGSPPVIHPPRVSQSKWELLDATEVKLDQLDGLKSSRKHGHGDDSFDEDVDTSQLQPGKKRVRWADVEEHKDMERQKAMGFVVGVTDWRKITGHFDPGEALTRTKYI